MLWHPPNSFPRDAQFEFLSFPPRALLFSFPKPTHFIRSTISHQICRSQSHHRRRSVWRSLSLQNMMTFWQMRLSIMYALLKKKPPGHAGSLLICHRFIFGRKFARIDPSIILLVAYPRIILPPSYFKIWSWPKIHRKLNRHYSSSLDFASTWIAWSPMAKKSILSVTCGNTSTSGYQTVRLRYQLPTATLSSPKRPRLQLDVLSRGTAQSSICVDTWYRWPRRRRRLWTWHGATSALWCLVVKKRPLYSWALRALRIMTAMPMRDSWPKDQMACRWWQCETFSLEKRLLSRMGRAILVKVIASVSVWRARKKAGMGGLHAFKVLSQAARPLLSSNRN